MQSKSQSMLPWVNVSFYLGVILSIGAGGFLIYEIVENNQWFVESLIGQLGTGLLLIYISGKPMIDERIRYLKFKGLAIGFVITTITGTVVNYFITYPDGFQENGVSSYWFVLSCLIIAFISFGILKLRE